jgi:hypothetical protein
MPTEPNRVELNPALSTQPVNEQAAPPERPEVRRAEDGEVQDSSPPAGSSWCVIPDGSATAAPASSSS